MKRLTEKSLNQHVLVNNAMKSKTKTEKNKIEITRNAKRKFRDLVGIPEILIDEIIEESVWVGLNDNRKNSKGLYNETHGIIMPVRDDKGTPGITTVLPLKKIDIDKTLKNCLNCSVKPIKERDTCPNCGSDNLKLQKETTSNKTFYYNGLEITSHMQERFIERFIKDKNIDRETLKDVIKKVLDNSIIIPIDDKHSKNSMAYYYEKYEAVFPLRNKKENRKTVGITTSIKLETQKEKENLIIGDTETCEICGEEHHINRKKCPNNQ